MEVFGVKREGEINLTGWGWDQGVMELLLVAGMKSFTLMYHLLR